MLLLQLLLPLQDMPVVFVFLFFSIHKADVSSTGIDHHTSGRSPQTSRIYSVAYVATNVSTEQEYPEPETSCNCGTLGGTRKHPNFCDSRNCHQFLSTRGIIIVHIMSRAGEVSLPALEAVQAPQGGRASTNVWGDPPRRDWLGRSVLVGAALHGQRQGADRDGGVTRGHQRP